MDKGEIRLHKGEIASSAGTTPESANCVVVMLHGRGDSARGILGLSRYLTDAGLSFVAPQATGSSWYPQSFLAPRDRNEPWLSSALAAVSAVVDQVEAAVPRERIVLLGFSQGACLATEFAAANPARYGGVVALSGGLIGPPDGISDFTGSLAGTPAFFGCSDVDAHIPVERVHDSARIYEELGADVEKRIYPGMGHTVNEDEIEWIRGLLTRFSG